MPKKSFKDLLEEIDKSRKLVEADDVEDEDEEELEQSDSDDLEDADTDKTPEQELDDEAPIGSGDYTGDDLREIIDYVYDILDREDDGQLNDSVGEIGLDLLYDYADMLPQTIINQIVEDLKEIFEIDDTVIESIVTEGAVFVKKKTGALAKAIKKKAKQYYKKNKANLKMKNKKWRKSAIGKRLIALHKKILKKFGKRKGKRLVTAPTEINQVKG